MLWAEVLQRQEIALVGVFGERPFWLGSASRILLSEPLEAADTAWVVAWIQKLPLLVEKASTTFSEVLQLGVGNVLCGSFLERRSSVELMSLILF